MDKAELRNLNGIHHFGQLPAGREIIVTKRAEAGPSPVIFEKTERKLPFNTLDRLKIERDGAPQPTETQGGAAPLTSPTVTALQRFEILSFFRIAFLLMIIVARG